MFVDRARRRKTYLWPTRINGQTVKVQDMMVDEIIIESLVKKDSGYSLKQPIYFSGLPYADSPLNLREKIVSTGILYKLDMGEIKDKVDIERSYDLYMNTYKFRGYENSVVYRDENATGVTINTGANGNRIVEELLKLGEKEKAVGLAELIIESYPEYWQTYVQLADFYKKEGDTSKTVELLTQLRDTLVAFYDSNPENLFYLQDMGLTEVYIGQETGNQSQIDKGINMLWEAYNRNQNSSHAFRKLVTILAQNGRYTELREAAEKFAEYKINLNDGFLQQILGFSNPQNAPTTGGG